MVELDRDYQARVRDRYNRIDQIWDRSDRWHAHVYDEILQAVKRLNEIARGPHGLLVDIGSGGHAQDVAHSLYIHFDIANEKLRLTQMAVCADARTLPLRNASADCVICVGAVANYCSLTELVAEIARIAKPNAILLLQLELSNSLEFLFTRHFRAQATLATTFYNGDETLWLYSHENVRQTLRNAGLVVIDAQYSHIASALVYRISGNANIAAHFAKLDRLLRLIPGIGSLSDSATFICRRSL